jgi:succinate dehydrogenase hydrophobic anchor subunit
VSESRSGGGGIGVCGLLGVVFVTLKLCGVIDWSWWWVTSPFWGPIALVVAIMAIVGGFVGLWAIVEQYGKRFA